MCYIYELIMRNHLSLILLLLTLRISKFTYEYVYIDLTSTYNLSVQQFLRLLSQPFLWSSVTNLYTTKSNCTEATVDIFFLHNTSFVRK